MLQVALSPPVPHSDWHPICAYPLLAARLTSLSDLSSHKLHRPLDALTVCNIQQEGLQSGGGFCCQICCTFLSQTSGYDVETFPIQLPGQQVSKATVTACDEHMLLAEAANLVGVSHIPADSSESQEKQSGC